MATFNKLSAELRNQIYELIVEKGEDLCDGTVEIKANIPPYQQQQHFKTKARLVAVNKQLSQEYSSMLYHLVFASPTIKITAAITDLDFGPVTDFVNACTAEEQKQLCVPRGKLRPYFQYPLMKPGTRTVPCARAMQLLCRAGYVHLSGEDDRSRDGRGGSVDKMTVEERDLTFRTMLLRSSRELEVEGPRSPSVQLKRFIDVVLGQ